MDEMRVEITAQQRLNCLINSGAELQKQINALKSSLTDLAADCVGERLCTASQYKSYVKLRLDAIEEIRKAQLKLDTLQEQKAIVEILGQAGVPDNSREYS